MAQFCTKCGAPMGEGMKFCTGCGATVGQPSAPATQAPPPPAPVMAAPPPTPAPVAAAATPAGVAPAAKSGSPIMKIILIVVAVIIFFTVLAAASCAYMLYRAKKGINQFEKQVQHTFPMPTGTREVHPQPEAPATPSVGQAPDLASLAYPGAVAPEGGAQSITGMAGVNLQQSVTTDSVDTVVGFYKGKLGPSVMVTQSGGQAVLQVVGSDGVVNIAIAPDQGSGKTKITLSRFGK